METVSDFILGGSKITVDGDCSHETKRHLLLGRKVMTNLDSTFKDEGSERMEDEPSLEGIHLSSMHLPLVRSQSCGPV